MWNIREAAAADRQAIEGLWRASAVGACNDEEWAALTRGGGTSLLVADEAGHLLGTAVASFDGWRAFIYHVAVDPATRGRGVAKSLMQEAQARLRLLGARRAYALVNESNTAGLALCVATGFEPEGDIAFVKELTGATPGTLLIAKA